MKAVVLLLLAYPLIAFAQVPVDVGNGISWPVVGLLAVVVAVIVGLIYWHRKNPTAESAALAQAHSDMAMIAQKAHDALAALIAKIETAKTAPQAAPAAPDVSAAIPAPENAATAVSGPTAEQLAAVAAARDAYLRSLTAAGLAVAP